MRESNSKEKQRNVLLVDQGLSFGGALVVLMSIAHNLEPHFRPIIVSAIQGRVDEWIDCGNIRVESCTPGYTYVNHFRNQSRIARIRNKWLRKLMAYVVTVINVASNIPYVLRLCRLIRKHRIDVIHSNNSVFVLLAAVITRTPYVWHFHGIPSEPPSLLERLLQFRVDQYLSISNYVSHAALEQGYPKNKLVTEHNPVADQFMTPANPELRTSTRKRWGIQDRECVIALFGRVIRWKGQMEFLKAVAAMENIDSVRVLIVGGATEGFGAGYEQEVRQFVTNQGLEKRVTFTGFVKEVRALYEAADIIVHSSIEPEPFGLVVTEAMACAKPVIASDLGAPRELVDEGIDGFVVSPTNTRALANALDQLASDNELRERMGRSGRKKIIQKFSPKDYALRMEAIYNRVIGARING
ncbi:glycosyltransferase family 4 protein [Marinobacteraceae bacterium S3BR75-40.1]